MRQAVLSSSEQSGCCEASAGRITRHDDLARILARIEQPAVRSDRIVDSSRERVLRSEPVVDDQNPRAGHSGEV
jgi:hypothetical protein